jgi:hypothetical protein
MYDHNVLEFEMDSRQMYESPQNPDTYHCFRSVVRFIQWMVHHVGAEGVPSRNEKHLKMA